MIDERPRRWLSPSRRFAVELLAGIRARAHDGGLYIVLCGIAACHLGGSL